MNEVLAYIDIFPGSNGNEFYWKLVEKSDLINSTEAIIAAGGEYEDKEFFSVQLCLAYPSTYSFIILANETTDESAKLDFSVSDFFTSLGAPATLTFSIMDDRIVETILTSPSPTPSPLGGPSHLRSEGPCIYVDLTLKTDAYGDETSWKITNATGDVVEYKDLFKSNATFYDRICLARSGCYNFTINDAWNDGICCDHGDGFLNISISDRFIFQGGDFNTSDTVVLGGSCAPEPMSGGCHSDTTIMNITIKTNDDGRETFWEVFDVSTGQIFTLNEETMESNATLSTSRCIPRSDCIAFAIDSLDEVSYEVSYEEVVVASGKVDYGSMDVEYFGPHCP